jgi:hypothetical protein
MLVSRLVAAVEATAGPETGLAALENAAMVKRFAVVGIGSFWLLKSVTLALPDAPTPNARISSAGSSQRVNFYRFPAAGMGRLSGAFESIPAASRNISFQTLPPEKDCAAFFCKYLYVKPPRQNLRYQASSNTSLVGRATDAASRIVVIRDDSGKARVNSAYFVRLLTSVAAHAASRPYWERPSAKAPLSDFGSTVGNDAGMNLLHEFGPGVQQMVSGHVPQFVSRIEDRVLRQQKPKGSAALAAR